jgi:phosphoribosylformimino-5-aminoimidazole carboxamide ribotide isomerase
MLLIPAIDIKDGKCVRLRQGRMDDETIFSDDPVGIAQRWVAAGARRLHIVDLDGAEAGSPRNQALITEIVRAFPEVPIQVGGGLRDEDTVQEYLMTGVRYVILGTKAVNAPHFVADICTEFPGRIMVALDAKDGKVATDGWSKLSNHDVIDLARHFESDGIEGVIYTDIGRDGMLSGVNIEATVRLARALNIPVYAAGGVTDVEDIRKLCEVADQGVAGAVIGRALYEGTLDFEAANKLARELGGKDAWDSQNA